MEPIAEPVETVAEPVAEPVVEKVNSSPRKRGALIGAWAYLVGIVIAALAAVFVQQGMDLLTYLVLAVLGIVVGMLNITDDEVLLFLVATIALVISANSVRGVLEASTMIATFLNNVIIFTAASAFIVSIKALFRLAKNE
jgi:hypothetical protein